MRPIRVEALEDALQRIVAYPRPVVIDDNFDFRSHAAADDAHLASGVGERLGVDQQIGDYLSEPGVVAWYREGVGSAAAFETDLDADVVAEPGFVGDRSQSRQQAAKIDRSHILPLQFGVQPARIGNVRYQPIEPFD